MGLYIVDIFLVYLFLAPAASALTLAPGIYAVSAVGVNPCLGSYLAYNTEGASPCVYLTPSDTSQPPLWRVDPAPGGFLLTAVNRTAKAPAVLTYARSSCSDTACLWDLTRNRHGPASTATSKLPGGNAPPAPR